MKYRKAILVLLACIFTVSSCNKNSSDISEMTSSVVSEILPTSMETTQYNNISEYDILTSDENTEAVKESNIKEQVNMVADNYFSLLSAGDFEATQFYLDENYNYMSEPPFSINNVDVLKYYYSLFKVKCVSVETDGAYAVAHLEIESPEPNHLLETMTGSISLGMTKDTTTNAISKELLSSSLPFSTNNAYIVLKNIEDEWKIITNDDFGTVLYMGQSREITLEMAYDIIESDNETMEYLKANVLLSDYEISEKKSYSYEGMGISNISVINNGNKSISALSITVNYNLNTDIYKSNPITFYASTTDSLKPGYSWKMEDDVFYAIEGLPSNTNYEEVYLEYYDAILTDYVEVIDDKEKYIDDYLVVENYKVEEISTRNGLTPALSGVILKNNGDKSIYMLEVTVYFQNADGLDVAEDSYIVLNPYSSNYSELKPNYSWKMPNNTYHFIKHLPDDIDITQNRIEITSITFSE